MSEDLTDNHKNLATALKWGIGIAVAAVAAPYVMLALKATLGVLAIAAVAAGGVAALRLTPWISMKLSNFVMRRVMQEAQANPIETLENLRIEKTAELEKADAAVVDFETEVRNYDGKTRVFARDYPDEAAEYQEISETMHAGLKQQQDEQMNARAALVDLGQQIDKAHAIYTMALAAERVEKLSKSAEQRVFQDIKKKIAFDAVTSKMNRAFASLNMAVSQRQQIAAVPERQQIAAKPSDLDLANLTLTQHANIKGAKK